MAEVSVLPAQTMSRSVSVPCTFCDAPPGDRCTTRTAGKERSPHRRRWDALASRTRFVPTVVAITYDQPRLGLLAGEQYLAVPYLLDPEKVTLLGRLPDGPDPQCNQYTREVTWLRWATETERTELDQRRKEPR